MPNILPVERAQFEKLFQMEGGYVMDFSNATLDRFVADHSRLDIYHAPHVFGEYVKMIKEKRWIESQSQMAERILKSSVSILESFNEVRNAQSSRMRINYWSMVKAC